jgi:hypothetical protein
MPRAEGPMVALCSMGGRMRSDRRRGRCRYESGAGQDAESPPSTSHGFSQSRGAARPSVTFAAAIPAWSFVLPSRPLSGNRALLLNVTRMRCSRHPEFESPRRWTPARRTGIGPTMALDGYVRVSQVAGRGGERFISPAVQREQSNAGRSCRERRSGRSSRNWTSRAAGAGPPPSDGSPAESRIRGKRRGDRRQTGSIRSFARRRPERDWTHPVGRRNVRKRAGRLRPVEPPLLSMPPRVDVGRCLESVGTSVRGDRTPRVGQKCCHRLGCAAAPTIRRAESDAHPLIFAGSPAWVETQGNDQRPGAAPSPPAGSDWEPRHPIRPH